MCGVTQLAVAGIFTIVKKLLRRHSLGNPKYYTKLLIVTFRCDQSEQYSHTGHLRALALSPKQMFLNR